MSRWLAYIHKPAKLSSSLRHYKHDKELLTTSGHLMLQTITPSHFLTLILTLLLSYNSFADTSPTKKPTKAKPNKTITTAQIPQLPLTALRQFADVLQQIRDSYVEPTTDEQLLEYAIQGMLAGLDPHSSYLSKEDFTNLQESTKGEFAGLGIEISMENGMIKVIAPIDDSPAAKAGLQAGDLIIQLDKQVVKGLSINEAIERMRGPVGTQIELTILRASEPQPLHIVVTRGIIKSRSVRSEMLEPGFGYLRIAQFQQDTGKEVHKALKKLQKEQALKGLVLDLRNNPGGVLQAAVEVSDAFLDKKLAVYTQGRSDNSRQDFHTQAGDLLQQAPMVVLINSGSASASEIVAGALQDYHRALIIGSRSFGKGSVQSIRPISEDKAIKLTTARYYTPKGRSIQAQGIIPDIPVPVAKVTLLNLPQRPSEADLNKHLSNKSQKKDKKPAKSKDKTADYSDDNQLLEALRLLQGLAILQAAQNTQTNQPQPAK